MGPTVVVDVPSVQAAAAERALETCNGALGSGACALANEGGSARWYAVVRFDPERQAVLLIQLYDGNTEGERVASTQLEFKDRDSELERWASAGVVVAALVAAQSATAESEPAPEPIQPPPPAPRPPPQALRATQREARAPSPSIWARLDLGATGGSELSNGTLRFGPLARIQLAFADAPAFVCASGAYTIRGAGTPDLTWVTGSLGFGAHLGFAQQRLALELRAEAALESVSIHASNGARSDNASRTRFGPRFGLDFGGYFRKNLGLFAGLEAAVLRPRVDINVSGADQAGLPPFSWGFISAVRYDVR